jgi:hypothetical protein
MVRGNVGASSLRRSCLGASPYHVWNHLVRTPRRKPANAFNPIAEHPGGCYTCRFFGQRIGGNTVKCAKPGDEHVRSQASRGCAFWQREPGADFDADTNENAASAAAL